MLVNIGTRREPSSNTIYLNAFFLSNVKTDYLVAHNLCTPKFIFHGVPKRDEFANLLFFGSTSFWIQKNFRKLFTYKLKVCNFKNVFTFYLLESKVFSLSRIS